MLQGYKSFVELLNVNEPVHRKVAEDPARFAGEPPYFDRVDLPGSAHSNMLLERR